MNAVLRLDESSKRPNLHLKEERKELGNKHEMKKQTDRKERTN